MNRQPPGSTPSRPQASQSQPGYRNAGQAATPSSSSNPPPGMYYASAGQQQAGASGAGTGAQGQGSSVGGAVSSAGMGSATGGAASRATSGSGAFGAGAGMRGGPPGFGGRGADPNDFPALGSHPSSSSTSQQQQPSAALQQQLFMQSAQTPGGGNMVAPPPPPPGLAGPATPQSSLTNGADDFPALGSEAKDGRMANYLRTGHAPPSPPNTLPNGTSASHSASETPLTHPPVPGSGSPSARWTALGGPTGAGVPEQPLTRPVQQILTSPVDSWGLKALLFEIQANMGKNDRGLLMFGEELSELGVDVGQDAPLHPTFVTPWLHPSQITQTPSIQESFQTPSCYVFQAPSLTSQKLLNFAEETLFLAFYSSPGDMMQLEVAGELYTRGWRFHMDMRVWMQGPAISAHDAQDPASQEPFSPGAGGNAGAAQNTGGASSNKLLRGPFIVFDPNTFERITMGEDHSVYANQLEQTRSAAAVIAEDAARREKLAAAQGQQQAMSQ